MDISFIEIVKQMVADPWLLIVLTLFCVGWFLKTQVPIITKYIPAVLAVLGIILGYIFLEQTLTGVISGFALAVMSIGGHSALKNTYELVKKPTVSEPHGPTETK